MNSEELFNKFVDKFENDYAFRDRLTNYSGIKLENSKILTLEEYKDVYSLNDKNYDFDNDKHFLSSFESDNEASKQNLEYINEFGCEIIQIESERLNSDYTHVWKLDSIYIKGDFRYESYSGVSYDSGTFSIVLPQKVEQIIWVSI